jgi:hypothetical protein
MLASVAAPSLSSSSPSVTRRLFVFQSQQQARSSGKRGSVRGIRERDVSSAAHNLPQDTPTPRRSASWKPKKREGDETSKEKVVIPKAKKPITKSYISQTALSLCLCFVAAGFYLMPETVASQVFGMSDLSFLAKGLAQYCGSLLGLMATLFFVLRELPFSYASTKSGYIGVVVGSVLGVKSLLMSINLWSGALILLHGFALGTAIAQLQKIRMYTSKP